MEKTDPRLSEVEQQLLQAVAASRGHFLYESGHHGDLWLDLEGLFVEARRTCKWVAALAEQAAICQPELVCGPLVGGAFVAQLLAVEMGVDFIFTERLVSETGSVQYHVPEPLRGIIAGRRVLLVDDAVNAGSALLSTRAELLNWSGKVTGLASLLTLGEAASHIAGQYGTPFFTLVSLERGMWMPEACLLCQSKVPLVNPLARFR
jgi:orotate phosphoribosyltransferase